MSLKRMQRVILLVMLWSVSSAYAVNSPLQFSNIEHIAIGDSVALKFSPDDLGQLDHVLHFPNGLALTYGETLSLGDFYAVEGQPISTETSGTARQAIFLAAFESFATNHAAAAEVPVIMGFLHKEQTILEDGIKHGQKPSDIFKQLSQDENRQLNCITGGDCSSTWWTKLGRYFRLAEENYDHFGDNALIAYQTGHALAIEAAIEAGQAHDVQRLEMAYAMNALASHYLSDRFSTGHIREPRMELPASVTPRMVGTLLCKYMHNEESRNGLHVYNARGDYWVAYGDHYYLDSVNDKSREILQEALQNSANEIFFAYQTGSVPPDSVTALIPKPYKANTAGEPNIAQMFYWDEGTQKLFRRVDLANVTDYHWTIDWWGWSTLSILQKQEGLPLTSQATLAMSPYRAQAIRLGLITDKTLLDFLAVHAQKH